MLGISYLLAITGSYQTGYTSVDTNLFFSWWQRLNGIIINQQGDEPTSRRVKFDGNRRWTASRGKISRPNYLQWFLALGKPNLAISVLEGRFGEFGRTAIPFLLEPRIFSSFPPEVSKSFLQMSQTLLQGYAANLVKKIQLFSLFPVGQQARSLLIANPFFLFVPCFDSDSQSFVVDQAHAPHCPSQEIFL